MSIILQLKTQYQNYLSLHKKMSYSKLKSTYASTSKLQTYKPQYAIPHVVRMQNLLEEYDRENSYLNKQVTELLGRKKQFDSQFGLSNRTLEQFSSKNKNYEIDQIRAQALSKYPSNRQSSSQKLKRYEYVDSNDQTKSPIYQAKVRHTFETSARKQTRHYSYTPYQNIQEIDRPINEYKNSYRNSSNGDSNRRGKINYLQQKNSSINMKARENSAKSPYIKPFLPVQQKINKRSNVNISTKSKSKEQPESTSRFVNEEQIKNQTKIPSPVPHNEINSKIINKQPYIGKPVEPDSSPSFNESPQKRKSIQNINDSMISLKSNKSRKSGIEVTSAEKPKERQKKQEQIKSKQKQVTLKLRQQQVERQKQRQVEKQREIQKQIQKEKEKLLQRDILRERERSMQIQRQIQIEKQKQKQIQALQERQKQLYKERQRTREKEKELLLLRQKQQQRDSTKTISPTKKQKTVTFADRTSQSPSKIIRPISNQQNLAQIKPLSYASSSQLPKRQLQQYQNYRPFHNYVPLVTTLPFGQTNSYFNSIIPNSNPFINKSQALPENSYQIQIPKRLPTNEIQEQNPIGRKMSSQHKIEPSQKISYDQGGQNLPRKQSVGSLRGNSRDKKKKYIKVISNDMIGSKIGQGYKK